MRRFRRTRRNRRVDRSRTRSWRAPRTLAPLGVAAIAVALLRFEPTPDASSMGFTMGFADDRRALPQLEGSELVPEGAPHPGASGAGEAGHEPEHRDDPSSSGAASAAPPPDTAATLDGDPDGTRPGALPLGSLLRARWLHLRRVHFLGLRSLDAPTLSAELGLSTDQALIDVDPDGVCAELLRSDRFAECSGLRIPPGTLLVAVRERTPVAVVEDTGHGLAEDGRTFALRPGEAADRPRVAGDPARALPYLQACAWAGIPLHRIEARLTPRGRTHVTLWVAPTGPRLLPGTDPIASLLRYRALAQAGAFDRADVEIDLRFRGRVVVRELARIQTEDPEGGERKRA